MAFLGIGKNKPKASDFEAVGGDYFGEENLAGVEQTPLPEFYSDGTLVGSAPSAPRRRRAAASTSHPSSSGPSVPMLVAGGAGVGALFGAVVAKDQGKGLAIGILLGGGLPLAVALATGTLELGS